MRTKIFCDSADLKTIKEFNNNPLVSGFTTNPSLMRKAGAKDYKNYSLKLLSVCTVSYTHLTLPTKRIV